MSRPWPTGGMSVVHEATLMCTLLSKAWPRQGQNPHSLFEFAGSKVSNLTFRAQAVLQKAHGLGHFALATGLIS